MKTAVFPPMKTFRIIAFLTFSCIQLALAQSNISPSPNTVASTASPAPDRQLQAATFYYLSIRLAVTTNYGVIGLNPGTRVQVLEDKGRTLFVKADDLQIDVPRNVLTSDIGYAQSAANADYAVQVRNNEWVAQQQQIYQRQVAENDKRTEAEQKQQSSRQVSRSGFGSWSNSSANPLNRGAYTGFSNSTQPLLLSGEEEQAKQAQKEWKINRTQEILAQSRIDE